MREGPVKKNKKLTHVGTRGDIRFLVGDIHRFEIALEQLLQVFRHLVAASLLLLYAHATLSQKNLDILFLTVQQNEKKGGKEKRTVVKTTERKTELDTYSTTAETCVFHTVRYCIK